MIEWFRPKGALTWHAGRRARRSWLIAVCGLGTYNADLSIVQADEPEEHLCPHCVGAMRRGRSV